MPKTPREEEKIELSSFDPNNEEEEKEGKV